MSSHLLEVGAGVVELVERARGHVHEPAVRQLAVPRDQLVFTTFDFLAYAAFAGSHPKAVL